MNRRETYKRPAPTARTILRTSLTALAYGTIGLAIFTTSYVIGSIVRHLLGW